MALAKWYKIDFHTHTPESKCFPDKKVTPKEWLKSAKESGINAVVVSDHNSVGWISKIEEVKSEFEDENFKVFYGIELCVSSDFTHFLIIFDDKMSVTEIEDAVVSNLGLLRKDWADTTINVSEDRLKTLCTELREKIFVIPAHFASNKGLGKSAENAIKKYQEFLLFSAVEVRNEEDVREYNNKLKNKAINKAVLITGSDNPSNRDEAQHSIEGFGKMFTWIKLSTLSFEGLRQVFIDPEHRCINWLSLQKIGVQFDPNETTYNYISGIAFEGISHMTKMNMRFSPNLNCIVGGRGTGKSTIVDAINYGVCNEHDLSKCRLLEKTLTKDAKISTYFNFGSNKPYVIKASRKGKQIVTDVEDNNGSVENPPEFKIDFYGQKEIFQIKIIDENGEIDINEGSPGQKSAAILAFILNSGENPLIIDQPEDDLDNSLIYSLVVKSIRKMKSKRQIIIVTHNPNIPVLGDAEGIIVLERNNQGKVTFRKGKKAGCIEEKLIREGICEIMEGGEDAFRKRERKYQYN